MKISIIAALTILVTTPVLGQDFTGIDRLEGWWAFQDGQTEPFQACRDPDKQYAVAIGRVSYDYEAGGTQFGKVSTRSIGFYDGGCELAVPMAAGRQVAAAAQCSFEGEETTGIVTFEDIDPQTIRVSIPAWSKGLILSACQVDFAQVAWQPPPRKLPYGSRVGMTVSVLGASALDTEAAMIYVEHSEEDARAFCVLYNATIEEECVTRTMEENKVLKTKLTANCDLGEFDTFYGDRIKFYGKDGQGFRLSRVGEGIPLDQSMASGYYEALGLFTALCPSRVGNG